MTGRHEETGPRSEAQWHAPGDEHPSGPHAVEHPQADYGADYGSGGPREPLGGAHAAEQWRQGEPDYTGHPEFTGPGPHPDFTGGPEPDYGRHGAGAPVGPGAQAGLAGPDAVGAPGAPGAGTPGVPGAGTPGVGAPGVGAPGVGHVGAPGVGGPGTPPGGIDPAHVTGGLPPYPVAPGQPGQGVPPEQTGPSGPYRVEPSGPYRVDQQPYPHGAPAVPAAAPLAGPPAGLTAPPPGAPGVPGQQPVPPPGAYPQQPHDLSSAQLLRQEKRRPQSGWRRAVYVATGHAINFGESPADRERRELIARINQPLQGCYKIAMLSLKGGVGKTTTTASLGSTFASLRGDRVIAVDANPDRGTLSQKIPLETTATVRHLLRDANRIRRYSDVRSYTSQGPSRLEVLASEQDPAVSEAFSEDDYRRSIDLLEHFYNIVLTDCGTGLMHSAMRGVLDVADSLVIVSSGSIDGARSASATLDWLDAHGYRLLVARSVAVINSVRPKSGKVDLDKVTNHFAARCRAVCRIPFDEHFEEGAEIELERLQAPTRLALLELAATVADDFPHANHRNARQPR